MKLPPNLKTLEIKAQKLFSRHALVFLKLLEGSSIEHISLKGTNIEEDLMHVDLIAMLPKMLHIKSFALKDLHSHFNTSKVHTI